MLDGEQSAASPERKKIVRLVKKLKKHKSANTNQNIIVQATYCDHFGKTETDDNNRLIVISKGT